MSVCMSVCMYIQIPLHIIICWYMYNSVEPRSRASCEEQPGPPDSLTAVGSGLLRPLMVPSEKTLHLWALRV